MSEEQENTVQGPPPIWRNTYGHLVGFGNGYWQTNNRQYQNGPAIFSSNEHYPCTEIIGKWVTSSDGPPEGVKSIDLTPYKYVGHPGWAWMFRDAGQRVWDAIDNDDWTNPQICSKDGDHYIVYGYGLISDEGELLGIRDNFKTGASYPGYMVLMQTPYDCIRELFYFLCYMCKSGTPSRRSCITYDKAKQGKTWGDDYVVRN